MVDDSSTKTIAYAIFAISFLIMIYFIMQQARKNRLSTIDQHAPKIEEQRLTDAYEAGYEDGENQTIEKASNFKK